MSLCSGGSDPDQAGERLKRDAEAEMGREVEGPMWPSQSEGEAAALDDAIDDLAFAET